MPHTLRFFESSVAHATVNGVSHFDAIFSLTQVADFQTCVERSKFIQRHFAHGTLFSFGKTSWQDGDGIVMLLMQQKVNLLLAVAISFVNGTVG